MGCGVSTAVQPAKKKPSCGECLDTDNFSLHQRRLVLRTWRHLAEDIPGHGSMVFLKVFEMEPAVKEIFPCRGVPDERLPFDPNFKGHASRFMQAVGAVMDNIEDPEKTLNEILISMGRQHRYYKGFKMTYFEAFVGGMVYTWERVLGERFSGDTRNAWIVVFNFIKCNMVKGYRMEMSRKVV
ncbi:hypothetical protein LSH36_1170g00001 [Paralvinella palmiformis]|uniref:Globin domain-containing protein n=1 Tax=Paralvinella palmiformis TaxID=53620 RepID=A0AAD9MPX2_9ANNE|nr:hypothetical protein LSH36_1170g00001 [Paralvinella palmiformis]